MHMYMSTDDSNAQNPPGEQQTVEKGVVFVESGAIAGDREIPASNPDDVGPLVLLEPPNAKRVVQTLHL
jgi:hypothetical protein